MSKKFAFFVFSGDPVCIVHVLLNALDLKSKGNIVQIVFEGRSTVLLPQLFEKTHQFHNLFEKVKDNNLVNCVCKACSMQLKVYEEVKKLNIPFGDEMSGHPSMQKFTDQGFLVITF